DLFLQKALAKAPAARFQSPAEYITAIEQLQKRIRGEVTQPEPQLQARPGPQPQPEPQTQPQPAARLALMGSSQVYPLQGRKLIVGREDPKREIHPDILLNDESKTVGRIHACLTCQQGQWSVEDRNSRNKTRLNGDILVPYEPRSL